MAIHKIFLTPVMQIQGQQVFKTTCGRTRLGASNPTLTEDDAKVTCPMCAIRLLSAKKVAA